MEEVRSGTRGTPRVSLGVGKRVEAETEVEESEGMEGT